MRISDWSSDLCSSGLRKLGPALTSKAAAPISVIRSCAAARRARRSAAPIGGATAVQRARLASSISVVEHPIVMSFSKAGEVEGRQVNRRPFLFDQGAHQFACHGGEGQAQMLVAKGIEDR